MLKGFCLASFDWARSALNKVFHSKEVSTGKKFVEVRESDIRDQQSDTSSSNVTSSGSNTAATNLTASRTSVSKRNPTHTRKRTTAEAELS